MDVNIKNGTAAENIRMEEMPDTSVCVVPVSEISDPEVEAEPDPHPDVDAELEGEGEEEDAHMLDATMASEDVDVPSEVTDSEPVHSISFTSFRLNEAYPKLTIEDASETVSTIDEASKIATTKKILKECEIEYSIIPSPKPDSPEYAATLSRLEADKMSDREIQQFPLLTQADLEVKQQYLSIRNNILLQWHANPKQELTCEKACAGIRVDPEASKDLPSPERIHALMNRICAINYGIYQVLTPPKAIPHKVIVVGAGIAGLAAARKLKEFGFDVVVVEARKRPGGRVETWRSQDGKSHAENGAMIVTGIVGNPLFTILHQQLNLNLVRIAGRCPLFTARHSVPKSIDEVLEVEFNSLLTAASGYGKLLKPPSTSSSDHRIVSLGEALDVLLRREELKCLQQYREHKENRVDMMKALTKCYEDRKNLHTIWQKHAEEYRKAKEEMTASDTGNTQWNYHLARARLVSSANRVDEINGRINQFDKLLQASTKSPPPKGYLTPEGRAIIGWHEANLEFANANHLNCLSLQHWDQDDEFELQGGHFSLEVGMDILPEAMAGGLDVQYGQIVKEIDVSGEQSDLASIVTLLTSNNVSVPILADAVLCTVPLGVLKDAMKRQLGTGLTVAGAVPPTQVKAVVGSVPTHTKYAMEFKPPLPLPLAQTIATMGFGTLNKVILSYKTRFWDVKRALFGFVNEDVRRRGEFFLFWSLYDTPTLVALVAGEAALALENGVDDGDIAKACHHTLKKIFGKDIEEPVESSVTHWGSDPFCQGSYSSVAPGASGNSYDVMATPLFDTQSPKLFFAGEHTIKNYPATLHGALLSGLREATKIADAFDPLQ